MTCLRIRLACWFAVVLFAAPGLRPDPAVAAQPRGDINSPIDLVVLQCIMPAKVRAGDKFQLIDEIENGGQEVAPESIAIFYLSTDDVLDEKDLPIKGRRVPPLAAGRSHSQPTTMSIDFNVPPGEYYLIIAADARREVPERIEGNNTKATRFTLLPRK